ncbi:MAG: sigma 54-interacting transcriptional regulator [Pseudomonadota bacterium]
MKEYGIDRTLELSVLSSHQLDTRRPSRGLQLRVASGPEEGRVLPVGLGSMVLGKGQECDHVLADVSISRRHISVNPVRGGVMVRDLGSTNGTFVNKTRVQEALVPVGCELRMGSVRLLVLDEALQRIPLSERRAFGGLIGQSPVMREVFALLERAAPADVTVLIEGPSGSGKGVAAKALHDHSARAARPLVTFDCTTVSPDLLASALMGHVKGAYTGAVNSRAGAFVEADQGTLFLDEIGELPADCQAQLLGVLETGLVKPVGGDKPRKVEVRVVAATNRDLYQMVEDKQFRLDLFHRLAVVHLRMPELRQHLDDLELLIQSFYEARGVVPGAIDGANLELLRSHAFEGNVRELRNILERSLVLAAPGHQAFRDLVLWMGPGQEQTTAASLAGVIDVTIPFKDLKERAVNELERAYLPVLLAHHGGNVSQAARQAGLSRQHLRSLLGKHGLKAVDS